MSLSETASGLMMLVNQGMVDADLAELNHAIVERMKAIRAMRNLRTIGQFSPGDQVRFANFTERSAWLNGAGATIVSISYRGSRGGSAKVRMSSGRGQYAAGTIVTVGPANLELVGSHFNDARPALSPQQED